MTAGVEGRPLTIDDLFAIRWLSDVRLSPDGRRLACVETRCDEALDAMRSRVLVVDLEDGSVTSPSPDDAADRGPRWAPDSRRLAFVAERGRGSVAWVSPDGAATGDALEGSPEAVVELAWHPAGDRLAIAHGAVELDADEPLHEVASVTYKVDGRPIRRRGGGGLRVVGLDGDVAPIVVGDATVRRPAWAPDGSRLAWIVGDATEPTSLRAAIAVAETHALDGPGGAEPGPPRVVTGEQSRIDAFAWSPDGGSIAWIGHDRGPCLGLVDGLHVTSVEDATTRSVALEGEPALGLTVRSDDMRGLAPDATLAWVDIDGRDRIYTRWADGGRGPVGWVSPDGGLTSVLEGERAILAFDVDAAAGRLAFVAADADDPGEVALTDLDGGNERRLTDRNAGWRAEVRLGETLHLIAAASDGQPLEAWLTLPPAGVARAPWPVVLSVHGGPHYPIGWRFAFEHHRLAATGVAVLAGDPRGSAGYGDAFTTAVHGDWGGVDHADLVTLLERALERPDLDAARVGITGVSYGGYMTQWAVTRDDRFAAAISENGICDLTSAWGTSHDGGTLMTVEMGGTPWDRGADYRARSPLAAADRIRTPLLLLHAEEDRICPIGQSEELFTALRRLDREVAFVRAPGEGHLMDVIGRPAFRRARAELVDGWYARHLGGGAPAGSAPGT